MNVESTKNRIAWYRSPVGREELAALNQRSDWKGFAQTLGHLGLLLASGTAAWVASEKGLWGLFALVLFLHGTMWAFLLNGFHELVHKSVFKTRWLNVFFLYVFSFLGWLNPILFWASHQEHHKNTLHPPDDLEVILPVELTLAGFLKIALVSPWELWVRLKGVVRLSLGRLQGEWENVLFPPTAVAQRRALFNWARFTLVGHIVIAALALYFGQWQVVVLVTLAPFYGGGLQYLCNNTQHAGLMDDVPDYRLCTRTILLDPLVQFLYWHMNYHIEHHMYAAVPCYNLQKLHELIKDDLPPTPRSLWAAWRELIPILKRQKVDPTYEYVAPLPVRATPSA